MEVNVKARTEPGADAQWCAATIRGGGHPDCLSEVNCITIVYMGKSKSEVEAITRYLKFDEWQTQEIRQALEEAERGELASPEEVHKVFSRWIR